MGRGNLRAAGGCVLLAALVAGCNPSPQPAPGSRDAGTTLSILFLDATPVARTPDASEATGTAPAITWLMDETDRRAADLAILHGVPAPGQLLEPPSPLRQRWPAYTVTALAAEGAAEGMLVVSRVALRVNHRHEALSYRMGDRSLVAGYGVLDITTASPGWHGIRILSFHLKDKEFHQSGQTEMRRNEARLLSGIIADILEQAPHTPLLIVGNLQDNPASAAYRLVVSPPAGSLVDLRPTDDGGAAWTAYAPDKDLYSRTALALATPSLAPWIDRSETRIEPAAVNATFRHRPLRIVLRKPEA